MERLAHLITKEVSAKKWKPMKVSRNRPEVAYLFFADDLVLFSEASMGQAEVVGDTLRRFCEQSGKKVSVQKSKLFCSANVSAITVNSIKQNTGVETIKKLGKYL